ncbi:histone-lysine N-methyltransferase SETMAR-like [Saccoglossus kowalevskii]|uniref:Histone-lysine N-methyltransferase SETMAR-like n=1 Tax=Saccoglossus kowalevskii TaxID=10224 RepID=A0ABM0GJS6_SACKO|nr:PREDICTED: histone-lysine N-methyltransferase SETMAR-like [Saccoglossus kowalevskii]
MSARRILTGKRLGMTDICNGEENIVVEVENLIDDKEISKIRYTPVNVRGTGIGSSDPSEIIYSGCDCVNLCADNCPCVVRFGPSYNSDGCILVQSCSKPIVECNSMCICGSSCPNRIVQNGLQFKLQVFRTKHKGWGLRTLQDIPLNRFVCEYAGEVIGYKEAYRRAAQQQEDDSNYIIILKEHLTRGKVVKTCVDPTTIGNIGRYINHSCDPNLCMLAVRVDNEIPKLGLFARRKIHQNEELSFDYAGEASLSHEDNAAKNVIEESINKQEAGGVVERKLGACRADGTLALKQCYCETKCCRGFLPRDNDLYSVLENAVDGGSV